MGIDWFWVIFDTSQHSKYFGDVHNLLALPAGATLKYDYNEAQFTSNALARVEVPGAPALFVYSQYDAAYTRSNGQSEPSAKSANVTCIGTRLGRIHAVTKRDKRYTLDFTVDGYPTQGVHLDNLMAHLAGGGETPLAPTAGGGEARKYVCVSTNTAVLKALAGQDDQDAWAHIVTALSTPPMQFSGDTFWRLKGPFTPRNGAVVTPKLDQHKTGDTVTAVESVYEISNGASLRFDFISRLGAGGGQSQAAHVEIKSTDNSVVRIVGGAQLSLRRHTASNFEVRGDSTHKVGQSKADLALDTFPQREDGWPSGPAIQMAVRVTRSKLRFWAGAIIGSLGVVAYCFGDSKGADAWGFWATLLKIAGILLVVLAGQLLSGELTFILGQ